MVQIKSVNQHNYLELLMTFYYKHRRVKGYKNYYYTRYTHTAYMVTLWLAFKFSEKFIAKQKWPPMYPNLNPCYYFLWGYLKESIRVLSSRSNLRLFKNTLYIKNTIILISKLTTFLRKQ